MKKSSPVFSFPKAKLNPVPLASQLSQLTIDYSINKTKAPSFLFGKTQKLVSAMNGTPGPGHYRPRDSSPLNSCVFEKAERQAPSKKLQLPGPFQYRPDRRAVSPKSPSYSMRQKSKQQFKMDSPGPGHYNIAHTNNSTSFKITQTKKQTSLKRNKDSPGPGSYNVSQDQSAKGYSFGNAKRMRVFSELTPGPGNYNVQIPPELNKSITIAQKVLSTHDCQFPGPGAYEIRIPSSMRFAISNSKKLITVDNQVPGPGSYLIKQDWNQSSFLTPKAPRSLLKANQNPGPSHYKPVYQNKSVSTSIGRKYYIQTAPDTPGPGAYSRNINSLSKISASLGKSKRFRQQKNKIPGPGSYSPLADSGGGITFPKQKKMRSEHNENSPGPGYYKIPATILNVPSYIKF